MTSPQPNNVVDRFAVRCIKVGSINVTVAGPKDGRDSLFRALWYAGEMMKEGEL